MDDKTLRRSLIRLAHEHPQHRAALLPLLKDPRLAVFSEPDPRIMMTQYKKLQAEFADLQRWSLTLQTSLRAVGKELPVAKPLMDLQLSQNALGASLEALEPLVHDYLGRRTQS